MQNLNKKGFSPILQITIISVLSIISIFLIWTYIADLSSGLEEQLSPVVDCINQQSSISNACINKKGKIEISINEALGEKVNNVKVNLEGELFSCDNSCQSCTIIEKEGKKIIFLNQLNENPKMLIASINNCNLQQVQIRNC